MPEVSQKLLAYVKKELEKGFSHAEIAQALKGAGWTDAEITAGFQAVSMSDNADTSAKSAATSPSLQSDTAAHKQSPTDQSVTREDRERHSPTSPGESEGPSLQDTVDTMMSKDASRAGSTSVQPAQTEQSSKSAQHAAQSQSPSRATENDRRNSQEVKSSQSQSSSRPSPSETVTFEEPRSGTDSDDDPYREPTGGDKIESENQPQKEESREASQKLEQQIESQTRRQHAKESGESHTHKKSNQHKTLREQAEEMRRKQRETEARQRADASGTEKVVGQNFTPKSSHSDDGVPHLRTPSTDKQRASAQARGSNAQSQPQRVGTDSKAQFRPAPAENPKTGSSIAKTVGITIAILVILAAIGVAVYIFVPVSDYLPL